MVVIPDTGVMVCIIDICIYGILVSSESLARLCIHNYPDLYIYITGNNAGWFTGKWCVFASAKRIYVAL